MKQTITVFYEFSLEAITGRITEFIKDKQIDGFVLVIDSVSHTSTRLIGATEYTAIVVTHLEPIDKP